MKDYIKKCIGNLRKTLEWKEADCESYRKSLVKLTTVCTAEEIAHGRLDNDIAAIGRKVEEIRSLREQIELLEHILENAE